MKNLQTLSKLKKRFACTTFLQKTYACSHSKKELCTHIFFEFGENLEIFQTHFSFFLNIPKIFENYIKQRFLCEFGVSFLQTRSKLICFHFSVFLFYFFLEKRNEFEVSLEILQTLSKLAPNSNDFILVLCFSFIVFFIFVWKRRTTLE